MKTRSVVIRLSAVVLIVVVLVSCIPGNIKDEMNEHMQTAQSMFADQEFKKAIAHIELHKLRNGSYPSSVRELQFLSAFDSSTFNFVEYYKLDSGYELNINFELPAFTGSKQAEVKLSYPEEFWRGLGCVKSNAKSN